MRWWVGGVTGSDQTQSKNSTLGNVHIVVVRQFAERVHHCDLWVRHTEQTKGKGDSAPDDWLAISREIQKIAYTSPNSHFQHPFQPIFKGYCSR